MVAYSFKAFFEPQISTGFKQHTVRAERRRHARPGETVQLYVGMRTRHCRKILKPDPICTAVPPIVIELSSRRDDFIQSIEIDGCKLNADDIEQFARADGFAPEHINVLALDLDGKTARKNMGEFWHHNHDGDRFTGMLIKWKPVS
ncbi:MAG: ASCH domain-containing protein [Roseibium sp.]|uniref:ASCH domain-containing protein n=1 Tax=Roseibium sp. TaxID=1936156 RepID=UPI0026107580|nr:ASCH domain-containing protein [Roseibium sp.]MCV0428857.1 ASCH domain-containing protein [Roseibium sp.]